MYFYEYSQRLGKFELITLSTYNMFLKIRNNNTFELENLTDSNSELVTDSHSLNSYLVKFMNLILTTSSLF